MVTAYVTIKANTGEADRLRSEIAAIDGVETVHIVAGDVDLIAKVDVGAPSAVKDVAADAIAVIDGVERTRTYVSMD